MTYGWRLGLPPSRHSIMTSRELTPSTSPLARPGPAKKWMDKLAAGDAEGPVFPVAQYLQLRDAEVVGNPRQTEEYRARCVAAVGLDGAAGIDMARYGHLQKRGDFGENVALLRWVVRRGTGCFWLPDSPRSTVRGFKHRLITRGPPVRIGLHRLNRPDTEWMEKDRVPVA